MAISEASEQLDVTVETLDSSEKPASPVELMSAFWWKNRDILTDEEFHELDEEEIQTLFADFLKNQSLSPEEMEKATAYFADRLKGWQILAEGEIVFPVDEKLVSDPEKFQTLMHLADDYRIFDSSEDFTRLTGKATRIYLPILLDEIGCQTDDFDADYRHFTTDAKELMTEHIGPDPAASETLDFPVTRFGETVLMSTGDVTEDYADYYHDLRAATVICGRNYLAERAVRSGDEKMEELYDSLVAAIEASEDENTGDEERFWYDDDGTFDGYKQTYLVYELIRDLGEEATLALQEAHADELVDMMDSFALLQQVQTDWSQERELSELEELWDQAKYARESGLWEYLSDQHLPPETGRDAAFQAQAERKQDRENFARARQIITLVELLSRAAKIDMPEKLDWSRFDAPEIRDLVARVQRNPDLARQHAMELRQLVLTTSDIVENIEMAGLWELWEKDVDTSSILSSPDPGRQFELLRHDDTRVLDSQKLIADLKSLNPESRFFLGESNDGPYILASTLAENWQLPEGMIYQDDSLVNETTGASLPIQIKAEPIADEIFVLGDEDAESKQQARDEAKKQLSEILDQQHIDEYLDSIKEYEIPLSAEQKTVVNRLVLLLNQEREQLGLPPRLIDESMVHLYDDGSWEENEKIHQSDAAALYHSYYQRIDIGGGRRSGTDKFAFLEKASHELVHAFSYNVFSVSSTESGDHELNQERVGFHRDNSEDDFLLLNEAITQAHANRLMEKEVNNNPLYIKEYKDFLAREAFDDQLDAEYGDTYVEMEVGDELFDYDIARAYSLGQIRGDEDDYLGEAYLEARIYLNRFLEVMEKRSDGKLKMKQLYDDLINAQMTGEWRSLARLVDQTLGPKMFARLGRATRKQEDFTKFVKDLQGGKTAAEFTAEALRKQTREIFAGQQAA